MTDEIAHKTAGLQPSLAGPRGPSLRAPADCVLVWTAAFAIVTSLVGLAATLLGVFQAPQVFLVSLVLTSLYGCKRGTGVATLPGLVPRWRHVALLILVALIFRVPAYHYVMGGQDEGVYVNIAHYIEDTGGIAVHDPVKQQLQGTPFEQKYVAENHVGGSYLAGVYKRGYGNGKLEFQFYDVFPIWMALFGGIFGSAAWVYALTFLALLSIALFYRIALLLTGSYNAGLTAGGLLALSPLHAFFSKFPVTEVPALCFALIGFLFLAAYWSAPRERRQEHWLVLSVLAFLCVFTTRISGFMYVPFFIALAWASLIFDPDRSRSRALQFWAIGVTVTYLVSVLYGLIWSHSYSHDIYRQSFSPLLGSHWKGAVAAISGLVVVTWGLLAWVVRYEKPRASLRKWLTRPCDWLPVVVVWAALLIGLVKIYRLGWTRHYLSDPSLGVRWHLADGSWQSAAASSLWTLIVFVGPLLVLAFLVLATVRKHDPCVRFIHWFVAGFFAYALLLQWVIPYSPYYARYLLSELVPYLILFVVCVWAKLHASGGRAALSLMVFLSLVYAAGLSATQIGKNENDGAYAALARISAPVGPSDLILLYVPPGSSFVQSQIKTPLLYTFHRQVVTVGKAALTDSAYLAKLDSLYDDVFLLTAQSHDHQGFDYVKSARFKVMQYEWNHSFPHKLVTMHDVALGLYRLGHIRFPMNTAIAFATGAGGTRWLRSGWSTPESWGVWSLGDRAVMSIDPRDLPETNGALLQLRANVFVNSKHRVQDITVSVDGKRIGHYTVRFPETQLSMQIPLGSITADSRRRIMVEFALPDATSPQKLGISRDGRDLALGLLDARIQVTQSGTSGAPSTAASKR